jgi:hypothetical protein
VADINTDQFPDSLRYQRIYQHDLMLLLIPSSHRGSLRSLTSEPERRKMTQEWAAYPNQTERLVSKMEILEP